MGHEVIRLCTWAMLVHQILKKKKNNTVFLLESELCLGKVSKVRKVLSLAHLTTNETNKQE